MGALESAVVLAWIAILFLGLAMYGLSRQVVLFRAESVNHQGHTSPPIVVPPALHELAQARGATLALFVDSSCKACRDRLEDLRDAIGALPGDCEMAIVHGSDDPAPPMLATAPLPDGVRVIEVAGRISTFGVPATPYGIALDRDGAVLRSAIIGNRDALLAMVAALRADGTASTERPPAPSGPPSHDSVETRPRS